MSNRAPTPEIKVTWDENTTHQRVRVRWSNDPVDALYIYANVETGRYDIVRDGATIERDISKATKAVDQAVDILWAESINERRRWMNSDLQAAANEWYWRR